MLIIFILTHIPLLALFNSYSARIISILLGVMPILWFGIAVVAGLAWKYQSNHPIFALILILGFIYFCFALARLHYRHFDMNMMMHEYYRQTADGEHPASGEWLLLNQHWGIRYISNATVPSHKPMHNALNSCSTVSIGGLVFIGMLLQALTTGLMKQIGGHEIIITIIGLFLGVIGAYYSGGVIAALHGFIHYTNLVDSLGWDWEKVETHFRT